MTVHKDWVGYSSLDKRQATRNATMCIKQQRRMKTYTQAVREFRTPTLSDTSVEDNTGLGSYSNWEWVELCC
jgi:hypothetical protein